VRGDALISGTSTDITSGVAQVYVSTDGGVTWASAGTSSPWTFTWHTSGLTDSTSTDAGYPIWARADDAAGNSEHTAIVHLKVDNTAPNLALPNTPMGYDPSKAVFLSSDAASGLDHAQVTFSGNGITPSVINYPSLTGTETIGWDGIDGAGHPVPPGIYDVTIDVWDHVGNHSSTTGQWARPAPPTETLTPTRMPTSTPQPPPAATNTRAPVKRATGTSTTTRTAAPTHKPIIILPTLPPLPPLPLGIPAWLLFLPAVGAGLWLIASGIAFTRDQRGTELRALRRSVADYLSQRKTNSKGGEDND
jgi:hypothetical protein